MNLTMTNNTVEIKDVHNLQLIERLKPEIFQSILDWRKLFIENYSELLDNTNNCLQGISMTDIKDTFNIGGVKLLAFSDFDVYNHMYKEWICPQDKYYLVWAFPVHKKRMVRFFGFMIDKEHFLN